MSTKPGFWCWLGLSAYVVIADTFLIRSKNATMSEVFGIALAHPTKRRSMLIVWAVLTLHLFAELLPLKMRTFLKPFDPLGVLARSIDGL